MSRRVHPLVGLFLVATTAACGVQPEAAAREVPVTAAPSPAARPDGSPATHHGTQRVRLFFVKDDRLATVTRVVDTVPPASELVAWLVAGPTDAERAAGHRSALEGNPLLAGVRVDGATAVVTLTESFDLASGPDDVPAFAEVVCTLTDRPDITGVVFEHDGQPVGIPRDDGSLSESPLTTADYAALRVDD